MGGSVIRVKRRRDPARTGTCPKCGALRGERCFNVDGPGRKAKAQDWTHPERLAANGFPSNATRTKPRNLGPRSDAEQRREAQQAQAERNQAAKGMPWEYGNQTGPVRRRVDNG